MPAMIDLIERLTWTHSARSYNGSAGGLSSQVTICEYAGIRFAVRENITGTSSFFTSSNVRQGDKSGRRPSAHRQSLELLAAPESWDALAILVASEDALGRVVLRNRTFTWAWVESLR